METTYPYQAKLPEGQAAALCTINILVLLINVAINAVLCHAIVKLKLLSTISYRLVMVLNISDLCIAFIEQPLMSIGYLYAFHGVNQATNIQLVIQFGSFSLCQFSGVMILIIALDRYLHMKYLNRYATVMTSRRACILLLSNFFLSLACGILYTLSSLYGFFFHVNIILLFVDSSILLSSFLLYLSAFMSLRKRTADSQAFPNQPNALESSVRRADVQFMKGILFIILSLSACYMPFFIIGIHTSLLRRASHSEVSLAWTLALYWSMQTVCLVPFINSLLFFVFNKKLKNYVYGMIARCRSRPTEQDAYA